MNNFFMWLVYSTLMGSMLAIIILLIKHIFKEKLGPRWNYSIWFLLLIKMIIPYGPETSFSIFNVYSYVLKMIKNKNSSIYDVENLGQGLGNSIGVNSNTYPTMDYALSINKDITFSISKLFFLIWIIGVVTYSIIILYYNIRIYSSLKKEKSIADGKIIKVVEQSKQKMGIKSEIRVFKTKNFKSPVIFSVFNTILLFPSNIIEKLSDEEIEYITLHELAHYKRKDILINWISILLQIIHWYNPIIWYGFYKMRQDREIACDAYVLSYLRPEEYCKYGSTIITMLENISFTSAIPLMAGFSNKKSHVKSRISAIVSFNEELNRISAWKIVLFLLLGGILLTSGQNMSNTALAVESTRIPTNIEYIDLDKYFNKYDGSFVIFNMKENKYEIYNEAKSKKRVSPYSTFKILIALTGLEKGILEESDTKLKWDGYEYPIQPWNRDHTLSSAMRYSVNWYFERVSQGIEEKLYKEKLDEIGYGNKDISGGITNFWMEASLKISPIEQVDILKKIYNYEAPFSRRSIDIVKETLKISSEGDTILSGKTGSGVINNKSINGWFIGYLEVDDNTYFFAVNIEGEDKADGTNAREIALSILRDRGLY